MERCRAAGYLAHLSTRQARANFQKIQVNTKNRPLSCLGVQQSQKRPFFSLLCSNEAALQRIINKKLHVRTKSNKKNDKVRASPEISVRLTKIFDLPIQETKWRSASI